MRKKIIEQSALEVATQVRAVEDSIEAALIELAELQSRMIRARAAAGIGIATGHDALEQVAAALQGLVAARGGVASAHIKLVEARQKIPGLRTVSFGDAGECPDQKVAQLRVVG
jgi:hypothetical protein